MGKSFIITLLVFQIYAELNRLAVEDCPSGFDCSVESIGDSFEGRPINKLTVRDADIIEKRTIYQNFPFFK